MRLDGPIRRLVLLGGGIGAGKSSVARVFTDSGYVLIEADRVGADILVPGTEATRSVGLEWPEAVVHGVVDRQALAGIVFRDAEALGRLEAITHPAISAEIVRRVAATESDVIVEVPVQHLTLDGDWTRVAVVAAQATRIARAIERGGDPDDVKRRVAAQDPDNVWEEWADIVIDNSYTWFETDRAIGAIIEGLIE
jgi:dephospho-CoA kinase